MTNETSLAPNKLASREFSTGVQQQQQQQQQQQPWVLSSGSSVGQSPGPAPPGVTRGLEPAVGASNNGCLPEHCSSSSSSSNSNIVAVAADNAVVHLPGQGTAASLGSSSRDIRWGGVQTGARLDSRPASASSSSITKAAAAAGGRIDSIDSCYTAGTQSGTQSGYGSSSSGLRCDASYGPAECSAFDINKTTELVEDSVSGEFVDAERTGATCSLDDPTLPVASGSEATQQYQRHRHGQVLRAAFSMQQQQQQRGGCSSVMSSAGGDVRLEQHKPGHQQRSGSCNVLEVLGSLLTAAAQLAAVQEVNLIANDPLQLDTTTTSSSSSSSSRSGSPATAAVQPQLPGLATVVGGDAASTAAVPASPFSSESGSSSSSSTYTLLPRPVRPLLVGIAAAACKRVLGYVLHVALQCTPRGGQLCVTARQSAGGVEVEVLHTGQATAPAGYTPPGRG